MIRFSGEITLQYDYPFAPFPAEAYEKAMDWLEEQKFDGAEICISNYEGIDVYRVKADLDRRKLSCSTISTGQSRERERISLLHTGEALKKAQERMKQHIDAAVILGSCVTLGLLRGVGRTEYREEDLQTLAQNLEPIAVYAQQKNVTIILEGINRYETCLLNSADSVMEFIEGPMKGIESIGVLWDIFHANIEDPDFEKAIERIGKRLKHVHLADSNRWFPGYGHIDFLHIVRKLKEVGFDGYISYECFNRPSVEVVRRESGKFVQMLREAE